ncbi:MAG: adenosylmethionine--8-amino-7-oxononanoate transaminase [Chryseolinea sp.]
MNDLLEKDASWIWHPFTPLVGGPKPIVIKSASGIYLQTDDGRNIIDAVSSWWVNLHGHSHPEIVKALTDQITSLDHVIFAGFTHEPAIALAENLLKILPSNQSRIFFSDNGSTAVEVALKMALQFWANQRVEKKKIVAIDGAYHGDTFGSMSVGARGIFTDPFKDQLFDVEFITFPTATNEDLVMAQFSELARTNNIAAFIFEPLVQGAAGMRMYSPAVLDQLLNVAKAYDIVCIADEVFTGFGRTGRLFASDYLHNMPDIISLSKGITGGTMPLGVTSCSKQIAKAFQSEDIIKTFFHGHSYTANPLACAVANASFKLLIGPECQQQIVLITRMHEAFEEKLKNHPRLRDIRCLGTILALELEIEGESSYTDSVRKKIYDFFLERNVLLRPLGNTIYVLPPYVITATELQNVYGYIEEFLNKK